jgi:hypothetical protein
MHAVTRRLAMTPVAPRGSSAIETSLSTRLRTKRACLESQRPMKLKLQETVKMRALFGLHSCMLRDIVLKSRGLFRGLLADP